MKLEGKVVLITGSSRGIGKDFARVLLQNGAKVSISDINDKAGRATYEEFHKQHGERVMYTDCDVRSEEAMAGLHVRSTSKVIYGREKRRKKEKPDLFKKTFDKYQRLDVVVNNAGVVNESAWEECVDINLKGTIRGTNLAMDYMRKDRGGHGGVIVNVSSITGLEPCLIVPSYAATKYGIVGFTKSWAQHPLAIENEIRMNCFCPGPVDTDLKEMTADQIIESTFLSLEMIKKMPRMPVDRTSECLLKLLEEEDNNGRCLKIDFVENELVMEYVD